MKISSPGLVAAALLALALPAAAQTAAQLPVKDATGTTRYLCETADGSGNLSNCIPYGAATAAKQDQLLTAIGSPLQARGKKDTVIPSASTDIGASITSSAAVTLAAANTSGRGVIYENQATTTGADCWVSTVATATADFHSLKVPAGGL